MKKYWKLTTLTIIIIVVFSVFYVNNKSISKNFPQFNFHKIEGDEKAVESLVVNGDLYLGMFSGETFQIDKNGTNYLRDESFVKRLQGYYPPLEIERLQKEHKNFMRGKEISQDYFYEDDNVLVYGAAPYDIWSFDNYMFEIAVLDKATNKTTSFTTPIPNRADYWYVEPYGVTFNDNKVSIVTMNDVVDNKEGHDKTGIHLYTFDVAKKELINEELVTELSTKHSETGYESVDILVDRSTSSNRFIVVQSEISYIEQESEDYKETVQVKKIMKYNLSTSEEENVPTVLDKNIGLPLAFDEENVYFSVVKESKLQLTSYSMKENKVIAEIEVPINNSSVSMGDMYGATIQDHTLYFVPSSSFNGEKESIVVVDLDSFTLEYYGEIDLTNPPKDNINIEMYFNATELRN